MINWKAPITLDGPNDEDFNYDKYILPIEKYCALKVYWRDIDHLQRPDNLS